MTAKYTTMPVTLDGKLDEDVWKYAEVYQLHLADDRAAGGAGIEEPGEVRLAWNDKYFYVGVKFTDSDVHAEGQEDEQMHFNLGDVAELFLKPADETWYWELYATPKGNKSTLWFAGRGHFGLPGAAEHTSGLEVAASVDGTLNNWEDTDEYWSAEMAVPIADLTARGESFEPGAQWLICIARYNYSKNLNVIGPELTMTPALSKTFFHMTDDYAVLNLKR
jgi:hypothetical protein